MRKTKLMSIHRARLAWSSDPTIPFDYERYARDHRVVMGSGLEISVSAAPEYRGNPRLTNPEELLVAALASCHMLTFLALCARKGIGVELYEDEAEGVLEKPESGPIHLTRCTLRPRVVFANPAPDAAIVSKLHEQAHRGCFIANSVKTEVRIEPAK